MTDSAPYSVPKEPGRWRAISFAVLVHLALLLFLWVGIRWQNETPAGVEAEIWSPQNQEAAPRPEPPVVEKKPEPQPEPKPVVKPTPKPPVAEPVRENPEIALEQEKKRKAQEKRQQEERDKLLKQQKLKQEQELADQKKEREKAAAVAKKEQDAELSKKQAADKQAADKLAADKKRKQDALDAEAARQRHDDDMKRLLAQAGTGGSGSAATTQGSRADSDYGNKVGAKIRSNTIFNVPEGLAGNPATEFEVELLPDGSIRSLRKTKSSGLPGFDDAVQRAIGKSAPFPPNKDGKVPGSFKLVHHAKDQ